MSDRLLVTGGSGFIGTNFINRMSHSGFEIASLDICDVRDVNNKKYHNFVNILSRDKLRKLIEDFSPRYIVHLAARTDLDGRSINDYRANTEGVSNLVEICNDVDTIERVIFASSRLVCPIGYIPTDDFDFKPNTPYGESKVIGEEIVRRDSKKNNWTIVRPTSIWGPWFGVPYNTFFEILRRGLYVHPKGKRIEKSFGFVGNSVFQLEKLLMAESSLVSNKVFYLCDYKPIEVMEWAEKIQIEFGVHKYRQLPDSLLRLLAKFGDFMKEAKILNNPPLTSFRYDNLCKEMIYPTNGLEAICGELPFNEEIGVKETVRWMRECS